MVSGERAPATVPELRSRRLSYLRQILALCAATLLLLGSAGAVRAHAHLKSASPPVDSVVSAAPGDVTVSFTERLEARLSSLVVKDESGRTVSAGEVRLPAGGDGKTLAVTVPKLPAGRYTVQWTAASVDTHKTTGSFSFVVRP